MDQIGAGSVSDGEAPVAFASGSDGSVLVGQVDRAFAERLRPGDRFLLDGRCLQVRSLCPEEGALRVEEVTGRPVVPRWGGDGWPLSAELARRLYLLRVRAAEALRDGPASLAALLGREYGLEGRAADSLAAYFQRQECASEVPDTANCLVEVVAHDQGADYYFHTPLNRLGNDALARVAVRRLARDSGRGAESVVADLGFALFIHGDLPDSHNPADALRALLAPADFAADLNAAVEAGDALRARFLRVAQTGLMLLRQPLGGKRRVGGPDWGARRLFDTVRGRDPHFVLLRQARREVLDELCDAEAAGRYVAELARLPIRCRRLAYPSPFVEGWTQTGLGPAERPDTPAEALLRLHAALTGGADDARAG